MKEEVYYCIRVADILRKSKLKPGDQVTMMLRSEQGAKLGKISVPVVARYRHHVLLDFGKYKECRRIVDIELGITNR